MDLVTFTEETLNGKFCFLCSDTDEGFCKVFYLLASKTFTLSLDKLHVKNNIMEKVFSSSFSSSPRTFSESDESNIIG